MKVSVIFTCELGNVEVDDKFRQLCHVCWTKEEEEADEPLTDELIDATDEALKKLGFGNAIECIDRIETDDGWLLYQI